MKIENIEKIKPKLFIATWQSLHTIKDKSFFEQFDFVINDECLHPDTNISMGDGSLKNIKDVNIGDIVKTYNESTKKIENKKVKKVHENISKSEEMYELELSNGNVIKITGNHKVLLVDGTWKRVDKLQCGDIINSME